MPKCPYLKQHVFLTGCQIHLVLIIVYTDVDNVCQQLLVARDHLQLLVQALYGNREGTTSQCWVSERAHSTLHIHMQSICCKDEYITILLVNNTPDKWNRQVQSHTWNNLFLHIIIWLHKDTQRPSMQDLVASSGVVEDCNQPWSPCLPSPTEFKWKQSFVCPSQAMILSFRWLQSN